MNESSPWSRLGAIQKPISAYIAAQNHEIDNFNSKITIAELSFFAAYLNEFFPLIASFTVEKKLSQNAFIGNFIIVSFYDKDDVIIGSFDLCHEYTLESSNEILTDLYTSAYDFLSNQVKLPNMDNWNGAKLEVKALVERWNPSSSRNA